jgi:hypothetical protein
MNTSTRKTLTLCVLLSLVSASSVPASSYIRFSERRHDSETCHDVPDYGYGTIRECQQTTARRSRIRAKIRIPGLQTVSRSQDVTINIQLGNFQFSRSLGDFRPSGRHSATYTFYEELEYGEEGTPQRLGTLRLTALGSRLYIRLDKRDQSITDELGEEFDGVKGEVIDDTPPSVPFSVSIESPLLYAPLQYGERNVYYTSTRTVRPTEDEEDVLIDYTASGRADFIRPRLSITSPRSSRTVRTTEESRTLRGTASDNVGLSDIQYRVSPDTEWQSIDDPSSPWEQQVELPVGSSRVFFRSVDLEGNTSTVRSRRFIRREPVGEE